MNPYDIDKIPMLVFSMSIFIAVSYLTDWVIVAGELQKSSAAAAASNEAAVNGPSVGIIFYPSIALEVLCVHLCSNNLEVTDILVLACQHVLSFY